MIINRIHIGKFGCLSDIDFSLNGGINLVLGDNESGKSTILGFIRFILFGLPAAKGTENNTEINRALSWDDGTAFGFMEISAPTGDLTGDFRIERRANSARGQKQQIIDMETGAEVKTTKNAGELFLGVSREVFDSVCCVRQLGIDKLNSEAVGSAINNILVSGDESSDTKDAINRLDKVRRELAPDRGTGGKISELKRAEDLAASRLREAEAHSGELLALQAGVAKYKAITAELRRKLSVADDRFHAAQSCEILKKYDLLHEKQEELDNMLKSEEKLLLEKGKDGKIPDGEYVVKLGSISRRLGKAESDNERALSELAAVRASEAGDPAAASRYEDIKNAGGAEAITEKYAKKRKSAIGLTVFGILIGLLGVAIGVCAVLFRFFIESPEFLTVSLKEYGTFIAIIGFILAVIGFSLLPIAKSKFKKSENYLKGFGFEEKLKGKAACSAFKKYAGDCETASILIKRYAEQSDATVKRADETKIALDAVMEEARAALAEFGLEAEDGRMADVLLEEADKASAASSEYEKIKIRIGSFEKEIANMKEAVKGENEESLREHLLPEAYEIYENIGIKQLMTERDALAAQLEAANKKLGDFDKNAAVLTHTNENPIRLAAEFEALKAEREASEFRLEAVRMAQEALEAAGDNLRRTVMPRIKGRASEILGLMTDGRYTEIGLDSEFNVYVASAEGTFGVDVLSGGTKDSVYFALRMALNEALFGGLGQTVLFDEVASQLDDRRTEKLLSVLGVLSKEGLCSIMFSCHTREKRILTSLGIRHTEILLS